MDAHLELPRTARLVLYTGSSAYTLAKIHDEYSIVCIEGDAVVFDPVAWYAIQLEVDGKAAPFKKSERVHMTVR